MMLDEWSAAVVEASTGASPPTAEEWTTVEVPGSPERFAGAECVAYRTRFPDPREGDDSRALLTLRGLYARGRIWLNGDLLGTHDTYFAPAKFFFDPQADNELVVEALPPDDRFGGVHDTDLVPREAAVPGIWWGAEVEGVEPAALTDVSVEPRMGGETDGFDVEVTIDARADVDDDVTFSLRPEGFRGGATMEQVPLTATGGGRMTLEHGIEIEEPRYWYPRGYGPQHHYTVSVRFGGQVLSRSVGLRTVERDGDAILVNGERVRLRGFNRLPGADPVDDVARAAEANANFVRAHAHVPSHDFHSAAEEAGLLVFQDLPLTGEGGYDIDRGRELARTLVDRYAHHPSVGLYGVHDDPRELYPSAIGGGRSGRYKLRWRGWRNEYNPGPDESVAEAFPADAVVFPVAGPVGIETDATHLYPGWDYGTADDAEWLLSRDPELAPVVTEFGAGALADDDVPDDVAGFDRGKHDAHVNGDAAASQAYQAATLKTVAETLRRHGNEVMAAFALRDTDDGAGMGVVGHDGTTKAGFDAVAHSFEPVQATLDEPPAAGSVGTTVVNDTANEVAGTLTWEAGEEGDSAEVSVDPFGAADGPTVAVPDDAESVVLELSHGGETVRNSYRL